MLGLRLWILPLLVLFTSCGMLNNPTPSTSCAAKTAQITVYEGGFKRICGCAEPGNVNFTIPQVMTCTIPVGTTVFFNYVGIQGDHTLFVETFWRAPTRNAGSTGVIDGYLFNSTSAPSFTLGDFPSNPSGGIIIVQ